MRSSILALCMGIAGLAACSSEDAASPAAQTVAAEASVRVVDLEQLDALLAAKRGKGLLVNFWATW